MNERAFTHMNISARFKLNRDTAALAMKKIRR